MSDVATIPPAFEAAATRRSGREWVLQRVVDWMDRGDERLLLVTGEPGVGKSVVAAWVAGAGPAPEDAASSANLTKLRGTWSAVCFCLGHGQGARSDSAWFIESLVRQLSTSFDGYATAVIEAVQAIVPSLKIDIKVGENKGQVIGAKVQNLSISVPNATERFALAVLEPLDTMSRADPSVAVWILVDGVDETLAVEQPNVVTLLASCSSLPRNVRFVVTSRDNPKVLEPLRRAFGGAATLDLSADDVAALNDADIGGHVSRRLAEPGLAARAAASAQPTEQLLDTLVQQAAGNFQYIDFLLVQLGAGDGPLGDLTALPAGLFDLYAAYLDDIVPNMNAVGVNQDWLDRYQPLLGGISVAVPAAPGAYLWQWLRWKQSEFNPFIQAVKQLIEYDESDGGGWQLFHRSMADFLGAAQLPARPDQPNTYYVAPAEQHDRIARFYLDALRDRWSGSWANCDDAYCARNLARHLLASIDALASSAERHQRAVELYGLVEDAPFRDRQHSLLGGWQHTLDALGDAIDAAALTHDNAKAIELIESLGSVADVELRNLVRGALVKLHGGDPETAVAAMHKLLGSDSTGAWNVALHAALAVV